ALLPHSAKLFRKLQAGGMEFSKIYRILGTKRGHKLPVISQKEIYTMWLEQYLEKESISAQRYLALKNEAK
ncbi:16866_t:CDS:1, partial [Racocetra fulgida]